MTVSLSSLGGGLHGAAQSTRSVDHVLPRARATGETRRLGQRKEDCNLVFRDWEMGTHLTLSFVSAAWGI